MKYSADNLVALLHFLAEKVYDRYTTYLTINPDIEYCYWSQVDKPILTEKNLSEFNLKEMFPEIVDIKQHTKIRMYGARDLYLDSFCPELQQAINELTDSSVKIDCGTVLVYVSRNYIILMKK